MTRQVVGETHAGSKDDASRICAARRRLAAQVRFSLIGVTQQPENAALLGLQKPHPDIEHRRRDLPAAVERAEHEAELRQSHFLSRRYVLGDRYLSVVWEIAVGQIGDAFDIE